MQLRIDIVPTAVLHDSETATAKVRSLITVDTQQDKAAYVKNIDGVRHHEPRMHYIEAIMPMFLEYSTS